MLGKVALLSDGRETYCMVMHLSEGNLPKKFYLLHVNFGNTQYLQERS